jgi:hypothetical protein
MSSSNSDDDGDAADIERCWDREIERRVEEYEQGQAQTYAAEDLFAEARHLAP